MFCYILGRRKINIILFYSNHLHAVLWTQAGINFIAKDPDTDKDQKS
jgi:hypothetical protein